MEMTSQCLASFHRYIYMRRFQVLPGCLIQLLNTSRPSQHTRLASTLSSRCRSHKTELAKKVGCVRLIHSSCYLEAGHAKWQNIKHIKAATDREKSIKSCLLARKVQFILDKTSETDPKLNPDLASLVKWARANNLTNDVINNTIDRQMKLRDPKSILAFGGRGPSNTGIMIECFSLKPVHTKTTIQGTVKRFGFNLNAPTDDLFEHKGVIEVELSKEEQATAQADPEKFPLDKYVEMAITAGAEDVTLEHDSESLYLQFVCGPMDVTKVTKLLNDAGLDILSSEKTYIPKIVVPVSQDFLDLLKKLTDKLDMNSDIVRYHFNVEPESL